MADPTPSQEAQELRHAALEVLATRHPTALDLAAIARRIERDRLVDFTFNESQLDSALTFLMGRLYISMTHDGMGATRYWTATSDGVLAYERGR